jgi:hypothetical protein
VEEGYNGVVMKEEYDGSAEETEGYYGVVVEEEHGGSAEGA